MRVIVCGADIATQASTMFEIVKSGGLFIGAIILSSVIAAAIFLERLWTLQAKRVLRSIWWIKSGVGRVRKQLQEKTYRRTGAEFAAGKNSQLPGLANRNRDRTIIKEAIEDTGRHVVHELERFINALGTIGSIAPLLGLLGTVSGMIHTFNSITDQG